MTVEPEHKIGVCWECGYSLRGLPTPRCPECGRAFDPADETTMNMGVEVSGLQKWLMRPPGWPYYAMTGVAALVSLWAAAAPSPPGIFVDSIGHLPTAVQRRGRPEAIFLWGALLWAILLMYWICRRFARGVTVVGLSKHKPAPFAYWQRWLWPLIVFGLTVLCCLTSLPMIGGFWLSRSSLNAAIENGHPIRAGNDWIGIYPLRDYTPGNYGYQPAVVRRRPGQEWVFVWDGGGFVHCDSGAAPREESIPQNWMPGRGRFKKVADGWYSFRFRSMYEP